jgi:nucleoside-diphosphate-sugar epimerase
MLPMKLFLSGATGLVGSHVLQQALNDARITEVVALTQHPLPEHPKLLAPVVDYDYPLAVAKLARRNGTLIYAVNSAVGG